MSFLGGENTFVARRDHHHHHQSRRKDDEAKKKKKKKRFSSVDDDDDEEEAGTTEAKAKVGRADAFLERLETALAEEPRVVLDDDEDDDDDDVGVGVLDERERKLEHLEIGLIAFAALLKTKGIDADKHEGLRKERKRLEVYKRKVKRRRNERRRNDEKTERLKRRKKMR